MTGNDEVAIVTGGSESIGKSLVRRLEAECRDVSVVASILDKRCFLMGEVISAGI